MNCGVGVQGKAQYSWEYNQVTHERNGEESFVFDLILVSVPRALAIFNSCPWATVISSCCFLITSSSLYSIGFLYFATPNDLSRTLG